MYLSFTPWEAPTYQGTFTYDTPLAYKNFSIFSKKKILLWLKNKPLSLHTEVGFIFNIFYSINPTLRKPMAFIYNNLHIVKDASCYILEL